MFNFKNEQKEERKYKGNTIYVTKYDDLPVEKILDILARNVENYVKQKGIMPEKVKLTFEGYNKILEHNKTLIEKREGKYYIYGTQIEV